MAKLIQLKDKDGNVYPVTNKMEIISNTSLTFSNTTQRVNIPNMHKYSRIRVRIDNSYARSFFIYFEKRDIEQNVNTMTTILSMADGTMSSIVIGRITLFPSDNQIGIIYDKANATFPLTLKEIIGYI